MKIRDAAGTVGKAIAKPFKKAGSAVKKGIKIVDEYTSPREETGGDFKKASYFQACFTGATEGFCVMGPTGILTGAIPAAVGVAVTNKTGKTWAGVIAGTLVGAGVGASIASAIGPGVGTFAGLISGGILGAMETFRGNPSSSTRDSAGNANIITAPFIGGPSKMAGGIGSAIGSKMKSKTAKSIVGGIAAAAIGGALAAVGFAPVSIPVAVAACAAAGALGPHLGPRYSQFFRNLSNDLGKAFEKGARKIGLIKEDKEVDGRKRNVIGAIPSSFIKEGIKGFALSDGNIAKMLVAGVMESVEQGHIFLHQKAGKDKKAEADSGNNPKVLNTVDDKEPKVKDK